MAQRKITGDQIDQTTLTLDGTILTPDGVEATGDITTTGNIVADGTISAIGDISAGGNIAAVGEITGSNLSGTNTGDQTIVLTGHVLGTGSGTTTNIATTLETIVNSGTGSFLKLTVDSFGRVTGTVPVTTADITPELDDVYVNIDGDTMTGSLTAPTFVGELTGNASSASILQTSRSISTTGDATWIVNFDGSANVIAPLTLATVNLDPQINAFKKITVNDKGLVTETFDVTAADITPLVDSTYVLKAGDTMTGDLTAPIFIGALTGNASSATIATALQTSRTISATGDATWSISFDGSANSTSALTLSTVNLDVGTFGSGTEIPVVSVNEKGLITAISTAAFTGTAPLAISLAGGTVASLPYQSAVGVTSFVAAGTESQVLVGGAASPAWTSTPAGLTSVTATTFIGALTGNSSTATALETGRTFSLTGDATGTSAAFTGTTDASIPMTLATVNASPQADTFHKATVNDKGLVTATSVVLPADIITALGFTPVNRAGDTMTGPLILNADPTQGLGAATKQYVDNIAAGLVVKPSVITATTATLATSSVGTVTYANGTAGVGATLTTTGSFAIIGGAATEDGNRILVKNEVAAANNGIYVRTSATVLTRTTDFDDSPDGEIDSGDFAFVSTGTLAGTNWVLTTPAPITVGTTALNFSQLSGAGTYTSGTGIDITGNVISNTGVISNIAGTGISVSSATGDVTIGNTGVLSITGTTSQITASAATGAITISLPSAVTISGLMTAGSFSGAGTGLTGTATTLNIGGNAATTTTLETTRTFAASGDATAVAQNFNGSANVVLPMLLATVNSAPQTDTFRKITVNGKGLVTATSAVTAADITPLVNATYVAKAGDTMAGPLTINSGGGTSSGTPNLSVLNGAGQGLVVVSKATAATFSSQTKAGDIVLSGQSGTQGVPTGGVVIGPWNFGVNGIRIDANGYVAVGLPYQPTFALSVGMPITTHGSGTGAFGIAALQQVLSDVTHTASGFYSSISTENTAFTISNLAQFYTTGGSKGANSTVTSNYGYYLGNTLTGGVSNYGFYGDVPAATGRWNFYANGTAQNYLAGNLGIGAGKTVPTQALDIAGNALISGTVTATTFIGAVTGNITGSASLNVLKAGDTMTGALGIGGAPSVNESLRISRNIPSDVGGIGILNDGVIQTSIFPGMVSGILSKLSVAASSGDFIQILNHYDVANAVVGSGTIVADQAGFTVSNLTAGSRNYGFVGGIAAGTDRWNLYMSGTAQNYLAGNLRLGYANTITNFIGPPPVVPRLQIAGITTDAASMSISKFSADAGAGAIFLNKSRGTTTGALALVAQNDTLGNIHWEGTDNTQLREAARISTIVDAVPVAGSIPGAIVFHTNSAGINAVSERMRITSLGSVGIGGVPANGQILLIKKNLDATPSTGAGTAISVESIVQDSIFGSAAAFKSRLSPSAFLNLPAMYHYVVDPSTPGGNSFVSDQYGFSVQSTMNVGMISNRAFHSNLAAGVGGNWNLYLEGTAPNYMAGNLGIGRVTPTQALEVVGNGLFTGTVTATTFIGGVTGASSLNVLKAGDTMTGTLNLPANGLAVGTNQLVVSAGNIGVGTTPSAFGSLYRAVDIFGYGGVFASSNTTGIAGGYGQSGHYQNTYYNGTESRSLGLGAASQLLLGSGAFLFYSAPSVAAGAVQAFTEKMRIYPSGNVGIGITTIPSILESKFYVNSGLPAGQKIIAWTDNQNCTGYLRIAAADVGSASASVGSDLDLIFSTGEQAAGAISEKMRITTAGSVGIGMIPTSKLDVAGTIRSTASTVNFLANNTSSTSYASYRLYNDLASPNRALEIDYSGSAYALPLLSNGPVGESASIATTGSFPLVLGTNNAARIIITGTGVVTDGAGLELGWKDIPPVANSWTKGKANVITASTSIGTSGAGATYSVYNSSATSVTITPSGITLWLGGTSSSGARTLLPHGFATIWYNTASEAVINGNVT